MKYTLQRDRRSMSRKSRCRWELLYPRRWWRRYVRSGRGLFFFSFFASLSACGRGGGDVMQKTSPYVAPFLPSRSAPTYCVDIDREVALRCLGTGQPSGSDMMGWRDKKSLGHGLFPHPPPGPSWREVNHELGLLRWRGASNR